MLKVVTQYVDKAGVVMFSLLKITLYRLGRSESGQGLSEYALVMALIAVVAITSLTFLGAHVTGVLSSAAKSL